MLDRGHYIRITGVEWIGINITMYTSMFVGAVCGVELNVELPTGYPLIVEKIQFFPFSDFSNCRFQ